MEGGFYLLPFLIGEHRLWQKKKKKLMIKTLKNFQIK